MTPSELHREKIFTAAHIAPTPQQLAWQHKELAAFFHFTVNTFTDKEWGDGSEDPSIFNPTELDTRQWVKSIKEAGFKIAILTAKHHDGFCLWPSALTEHSVKHSPYKDGDGDVVAEFTAACAEFGVGVGIYLSPWDRHEPTYGTPEYNTYFISQLTELLTQYGPIAEVWFDGACAEGPNGRRQVYDWNAYYGTVRKLQPDAVISGTAPDVRWVGNESGLARENEWSVVPAYMRTPEIVTWEEGTTPPDVKQEAHDLGSRAQVMAMDEMIWYPAECDVSIRPGWFYHASEDGQVKSPEALVDLYYKSVGRNSFLLLNLPPDRRGLLHERDVESLRGFRRMLDETFAVNLACTASVSASHEKEGFSIQAVLDGSADTWWTTADWQETAEVTLTWATPQTFNIIELQERIAVGQRIEKFHVDAWVAGEWKKVAEGGTVGYKRLLHCEETTTDRVRIVIEESRFAPTLERMGVYLDKEKLIVL